MNLLTTVTGKPPEKTPGETPDVRHRDALSADDLLHLLRQMLAIRRFEDRTAQSYQQARIGGFCHLYSGQEAVAVGSIAALRDQDPIITAYRDHGHALARGMDPRYAMAEMFGKVTGCSKGKGGSMHLFDKSHHMYGGHAIVGGQVPLGVGLAFATKYLGEDHVTACYLGDGALNQGAFHESMNLAALWQLPILIVVENNGYSMGTAIGRGTAGADRLDVRAEAYGMRYDTCDGMDVLAVYDCFTTQAQRTRDGDGPALIDVKTYRFKGHSMSDPQKYRTREEVAQFEEQDPIKQLAAVLEERSIASEDDVAEIDYQIKQQMREAVKYANDAPDVGIDEMYTDVYADPFDPYVKGQPPAMGEQEDEQ